MSFHDLPEDAYPFTVVATNEEGDEVWRIDVPEPGGVHVPGKGDYEGRITVTVHWGNGAVTSVVPE